MLDNKVKRIDTSLRVKNDLEILQELSNSFDSTMSQYKLNVIVSDIFLLYFTDNAFELDYDEHFVFIQGSTTEI